jgi:hypothetical protein
MGLATPFPEPESPELRRFVIRSRPRIVEVLRAMCDEAAQVNVFDSVGDEFDVATFRRIDEAAGQVYCDMPGARSGSGAGRTLAEATFVGFAGADKVQFTALGSGLVASASRPGLSVQVPQSLLLLKRRRSERMPAGGHTGSECRLRLPDGPWANQPLAVHDLSVGGLAVDVSGGTDQLSIGARIERCKLDLPGVGGMQIGLTIRHLTDVPGSDAVRRVGLEFFRPAPGLLAVVERFLSGD